MTVRTREGDVYEAGVVEKETVEGEPLLPFLVCDEEQYSRFQFVRITQ